MNVVLPLLKLLSGIGLFLFSMYLMEEALKTLSGRRFKQFLKRMSSHRIGAVAGGAITTGILQSSSMVSVMVLAFVGTGIFTMRNALAIILGANLGTTLDSWVVVFFGFKYDIGIIAYPIVFVGGLLLILFEKRNLIKYLSFFMIGFGLLFLSLALMKTAMEAEVIAVDLSAYKHTALPVFLLIGFILTLLIQSSSVTMALALSAMHAGAIELPAAAALVLGSETGTTIKMFLGVIGSNASKKRVVLGNLFFNVFLTIFSLIFLKSLLLLITDGFKIKDPMIALVTFSTMVNLISILIFLPFLNIFSKFLEKLFKRSANSTVVFLEYASLEAPESAVELFKKETRAFLYKAMLFNMSQLEISTNNSFEIPEPDNANGKNKFLNKPPEEQYEILKKWQGEIQHFYLKLRPKLTGEWMEQLNQLNSGVRGALYAAKSIKDVRTNILDLERSSKDIKFQFFTSQQIVIRNFYKRLGAVLVHNGSMKTEEAVSLADLIDANYTKSLNDFYKKAQLNPIEDMDLTTVINFNREVYSSNKSMLNAIKDYFLYEENPTG